MKSLTLSLPSFLYTRLLLCINYAPFNAHMLYISNLELDKQKVKTHIELIKCDTLPLPG